MGAKIDTNKMLQGLAPRPEAISQIDGQGIKKISPYNMEPMPGMLLDENHVQSLKDKIKDRGFTSVLNVRPKPGSPGKFQIIGGHHRWTAVMELINEGHLQKNMVLPATVEQIDDIVANFDMYAANSEARRLMPIEQLKQVDAYLAYYQQQFDRGELELGKTVREAVCKSLRISQTQMYMRQAILRKLYPELLALFGKYYFNITSADFLSKKDGETQRAVARVISSIVPQPKVDITSSNDIKTALSIKQIEEIVEKVNQNFAAGTPDAPVYLSVGPDIEESEDPQNLVLLRGGVNDSETHQSAAIDESVKLPVAKARMQVSHKSSQTEKNLEVLEKAKENLSKVNKRLKKLAKDEKPTLLKNRTKFEKEIKEIRAALRVMSEFLDMVKSQANEGEEEE